MKSEKLYTALTNIREEHVLAAQKAPRFLRKVSLLRRCAGAAAAILAVVIAGSALLWPLGGTKVVAAAEYPRTAQYPIADFSVGDYTTWRQNNIEHRLEEGEGQGLQEYVKRALPTFLAQGGENCVFSPLNSYFALGMLAEVTAGESRAQLLHLLGCEDMEAMRAEAKALWLASYRKDGVVSSIPANSLWLSEEFSFLPEPFEALAQNWYASAYRGKMGGEDINAELRAWLNAQTGGLLEESAEAAYLPEETVMALASTLYFRAKWQEEFAKARTKPGVFRGKDGEYTCEFMHQSENKSLYWGERFTAVGQALTNGGDMFFILPDEGISSEELLADAEVVEFLLQGENWQKQKYLYVNESIPKFDITSSGDLKEGLRSLGVVDVFDSARADFSSIAEDAAGIYVSNVSHSVRVAIDEEGCTAAAFTVIAEPGAAPGLEESVDFVLDRPFLFAITGADGQILFAGHILQP